MMLMDRDCSVKTDSNSIMKERTLKGANLKGEDLKEFTFQFTEKNKIPNNLAMGQKNKHSYILNVESLKERKGEGE